MTLKPDEICKHSNNCPYHKSYDSNSFCHGTIKRDIEFICNFIKTDGTFVNENEAYQRNINDITGKMVPILE